MMSLIRMIMIASIFAFTVLAFTDLSSYTAEGQQIFTIFLAILSTMIGMAFNILIKVRRLTKLSRE